MLVLTLYLLGLNVSYNRMDQSSFFVINNSRTFPNSALGEDEGLEKSVLNVEAKYVIHLPNPPFRVFNPGERVFAMFTNTTTFYPAIVEQSPVNKRAPSYHLKFDDDEDADGEGLPI